MAHYDAYSRYMADCMGTLVQKYCSYIVYNMVHVPPESYKNLSEIKIYPRLTRITSHGKPSLSPLSSFPVPSCPDQ